MSIMPEALHKHDTQKNDWPPMYETPNMSWSESSAMVKANDHLHRSRPNWSSEGTPRQCAAWLGHLEISERCPASSHMDRSRHVSNALMQMNEYHLVAVDPSGNSFFCGSNSENPTFNQTIEVQINIIYCLFYLFIYLFKKKEKKNNLPKIKKRLKWSRRTWPAFVCTNCRRNLGLN